MQFRNIYVKKNGTEDGALWNSFVWVSSVISPLTTNWSLRVWIVYGSEYIKWHKIGGRSTRLEIKIEGMTSSKALERSRKRHAVEVSRVKLVWISVVSMDRLYWHERKLRKPNYEAGSFSYLSTHQPNLRRMSFSRVLRQQEMREMGRNWPGVVSGMR